MECWELVRQFITTSSNVHFYGLELLGKPKFHSVVEIWLNDVEFFVKDVESFVKSLLIVGESLINLYKLLIIVKSFGATSSLAIGQR